MPDQTNRQIALKLGATTYAGAPCKRGHAGERYTLKGACVDCAKAAARLPISDADRARRKAWKAANPAAVRASEAERKARRKADYQASGRSIARARIRALGQRITAWSDALTDAAKATRAHTAAIRKAARIARYRTAIAREERSAKAASATARWRATNPVGYRANARLKRQRRAEREQRGGPQPSQAERMTLLEAQAHCCAYCPETRQLELDHKWPTVRGGSNAIHNRQWLCRLCNNLKHDTPDAEYRRQNGLPEPIWGI